MPKAEWKAYMEYVRNLPTAEQVEFCDKWGIKYSTLERELRRKGNTGHRRVRTDEERELSAIEKKVEFMSKGRTIGEIEAEGYDLEVPEGYDLFETRNHYFEKVYLLLPKTAPVVLQPKCWTYRWAEGQPYMMLQFPDRDWDKIKVVPIADVHYGSQACMVDKFREYINWIARSDNVFCFISGDLFENSHGDSNKGISIYEQEIRPKSQVEQMAELLAPIAHKVLWAIPGNHEDRSRTRDFDPLELLCTKLQIPYSYEPVFVDLLWKGNIWSVYDQHGRSASNTNGGKLNAATRPLDMQEFCNFVIMAHVHDGKVDRTERICRDRVNFKLEFKRQYVIICPSFFGYFGSYASKAGYKPGSYGSINFDLFANSDYHANA